MSFNGGPLIARGPEFTKVGLETEIQIPFRTWLICAAVSMVDVLSFVGILILTSRQFWNWKHPPHVYGRGWWPSVASSLAMWWPSIGIAILSGIILWSIPLLYRFLVETITKQGPQYTAYPAERGRWKPFKPDPIEYDMFDAEAEAEAVEKNDTVDVNLTAQPKGSKRPQIKVFPKFPNGKKERAFYKAVGAELSAFSEGGAAEHEVSQRQFRKIRDALMKRKCADWKNKRRHKDGVDLFDSGRGLLKARGR